jgi:hypothetical protein
MSSSGSPQADIAGCCPGRKTCSRNCAAAHSMRWRSFLDSDRGKAVFALCCVSYEHGLSLRSLISNGYMTSALSLMRLQYEALTRAMWSMYVAPDSAIEKLTASLTLETEQASRSLPSLSQMLEQIVDTRRKLCRAPCGPPSVPDGSATTCLPRLATEQLRVPGG